MRAVQGRPTLERMAPANADSEEFYPPHEVRRFAWLPRWVEGHGWAWLRHYFSTRAMERTPSTEWGNAEHELSRRIDPSDDWWFR